MASAFPVKHQEALSFSLLRAPASPSVNSGALMDIIFEFIGGPLDGTTVEGKAGEQDEADRYYVLTHHGRIGQRFRVASSFAIEMLAQDELVDDKPHQFQPHRYEVIERLQSGAEVLVRAKYVDKESKGVAAADFKIPAGPPAERAESTDQSIRRFFELAAKSLRELYSHSWPANERGTSSPSKEILALHVAHVLLSENLAVFADAPHPTDVGKRVDLLGIAASQDWFLACVFASLVSPEGVRMLWRDVEHLKTFWLSPEITIDACRDHVRRLAQHCERGYGAVAGLFAARQASGGAQILEFWKTRQGQDQAQRRLAQTLAELKADFSPPLVVHTSPGAEAYYLLYAFFPIPRPPSETSSQK
jgi:hypothetical protein